MSHVTRGQTNELYNWQKPFTQTTLAALGCYRRFPPAAGRGAPAPAAANTTQQVQSAVNRWIAANIDCGSAEEALSVLATPKHHGQELRYVSKLKCRSACVAEKHAQRQLGVSNQVGPGGRSFGIARD